MQRCTSVDATASSNSGSKMEQGRLRAREVRVVRVPLHSPIDGPMRLRIALTRVFYCAVLTRSFPDGCSYHYSSNPFGLRANKEREQNNSQRREATCCDPPNNKRNTDKTNTKKDGQTEKEI